MGRRAVAILVLLATLALSNAAPVGSAQSAGEHWTLAAIHVTGSQRFKEQRIVQASGLKTGSTVSKEDLDRAAQRLAALGAFVHVGFRYGPAGGGVAVTFQVTDGEQFLDCRFANLIWVPEDQLLTALKSRVPLFDDQVPTAGDMGDRIDRALEAILREHGVIASVDHGYFQSSTRAPISAEVFTAHGPSLPIREVVFTGNTVVGSAALAKAVEPLIGHQHDEVFEEDFLKGDPADLYAEKGYLRIRFGRPQPALMDSSGASGPVRIAVRVSEGLQYNLGEVAFSGNTAFTGEQLAGQIHVETGKTANGVQLDRDLRDMADLYATRGYLSARAEATPSFDEASRTVNYQVAVTEGDQYRMGQLIVIGIDGAHVDMLKHDCKLRRGDPFDQSYWKYFLVTNAKDLPAGADKSKKIWKNQVNHDTRTVDVTLTFDPPVQGSSDLAAPNIPQ
jgi:outer membrane protein insertion porin family